MIALRAVVLDDLTIPTWMVRGLPFGEVTVLSAVLFGALTIAMAWYHPRPHRNGDYTEHGTTQRGHLTKEKASYHPRHRAQFTEKNGTPWPGAVPSTTVLGGQVASNT